MKKPDRDAGRPPRNERERQLRELPQTPRGRQELREPFDRIYPDGVPLPPEDAMITILLDHEYAED